jgi:hypothetical protein
VSTITDEKSIGTTLLSRVTCPHCWHKFPPDETNWVSVHPDLRGDERLDQPGSKESPRRFLPTRFNVEGLALDVRGQVCRETACPHCHLSVTRASLELPPSIVSIIGSPGSGKSYFLASMIWQARKTLSGRFDLSFADADLKTNAMVNGYESDLFMQDDEDGLMILAKTYMGGDLYNEVYFENGRAVNYSKPFLFTVQPETFHPYAAKLSKSSRLLVLYDNAGEHFQPESNRPDQPGTEHLAHAQVLFFLFDPTQHPQFRRACRSFSTDPQLTDPSKVNSQHILLNEAGSRIRQWTGLSHTQKDKRPLVVIVTKYDVWAPMLSSLLPRELSLDEIVFRSRQGLCGLRVEELARVSKIVERFLREHTPEIVTAANALSEEVVFVPVSSLGTSPVKHPDPAKQNGFYVRTGSIKPQWAEVPLLYALHRTSKGLVPGLKAKT